MPSAISHERRLSGIQDPLDDQRRTRRLPSPMGPGPHCGIRQQASERYVQKRFCAPGKPCSQPSEMSQPLPGITSKIFVSDIQETSHPLSHRRRALLVYFHIVKALALLREPLAYESVEKIIELLKLASFDPVFVGEAAKGLGIVAEGKGGDKGKGKAKGTGKGKGKERDPGWTLTAKVRLLVWRLACIKAARQLTSGSSSGHRRCGASFFRSCWKGTPRRRVSLYFRCQDRPRAKRCREGPDRVPRRVREPASTRSRRASSLSASNSMSHALLRPQSAIIELIPTDTSPTSTLSLPAGSHRTAQLHLRTAWYPGDREPLHGGGRTAAR